MKKITMFYLTTCPHCQRAFGWMEEAIKENPSYGEIEIEKIEESQQPEIADAMDYYYVPTYYIEGKKVHEGIASLEIVKNVFDQALAE